MKLFFKIIGGILLFTIICLAVFIIVQTNDVHKGKVIADQEYKNKRFNLFENFGSVKKLSIIPLIDYAAAEPGLKTETGVSYVIRADDTVILMDVGYNRDCAYSSTLLQNIDKLGVKINDIDMLFFSHPHLDHMGGTNKTKEQIFSLAHGKLEMAKITDYFSMKMKQFEMTPAGEIAVNQKPFILKPGIGSIGSIPRHLFMVGKVYEQSLAIHVSGKGIVLIIGCGHQGIDTILERTSSLFKEPIYAIIGGFHYPIHGGKIMMGLLYVPYIVGADATPWNGSDECDVLSAIEIIKKSNVAIVALSPHDSSGWAFGKFKEHLGNRAVELKVGMEIKI